MRLIVSIVLSLIAWSSASAQELVSYGGYFNYYLDNHSANFQQLPGVPSCCPRFEDGSGSGVALGILFQFPLSPVYELSVRSGIALTNGTLSKIETTTVYHSNATAIGAFEHTVDASWMTIHLEPMMGYRIIDNLKAHLGFTTGMVVRSSYSQEERITQPMDGGTFIDSNGNDTQSRIRNQSSGEIPGALPFQLRAVIGLSYKFTTNLERTWFIQPEIFYSFGLTSMAANLNWRVNSLRLGIAIITTTFPEPPSTEKRK